MSKPLTLAAFTATKNALSRGCCLLECAVAVIHDVDSWVWLDGFSTDGTWELIQKMAAANPKIRAGQAAWQPSSPDGEAIGAAHQMAANRCRGNVAWEIQSDEVYGPGAAGALREAFADPAVNSACVVFKTLWRWDRLMLEKGWTAWRVRAARTGRGCRVPHDASNMGIVPRVTKVAGAVCWNTGFAFTGHADTKTKQNADLHASPHVIYPWETHPKNFHKRDPETAAVRQHELPELIQPLYGASRYEPDLSRLDALKART
ncbi:MAG: hypothetical protein A2Y38_22365 [Spirochaetes bacterium GWB1_59_5]|nr:MAG: hypothetical protein A2Y38_22365 [Spirochaetes bacterium GWB1_59_5]